MMMKNKTDNIKTFFRTIWLVILVLICSVIIAVTCTSCSNMYLPSYKVHPGWTTYQWQELIECTYPLDYLDEIGMDSCYLSIAHKYNIPVDSSYLSIK
jgi:hypothetical protein